MFYRMLIYVDIPFTFFFLLDPALFCSDIIDPLRRTTSASLIRNSTTPTNTSSAPDDASHPFGILRNRPTRFLSNCHGPGQRLRLKQNGGRLCRPPADYLRFHCSWLYYSWGADSETVLEEGSDMMWRGRTFRTYHEAACAMLRCFSSRSDSVGSQ